MPSTAVAPRGRRAKCRGVDRSSDKDFADFAAVESDQGEDEAQSQVHSRSPTYVDAPRNRDKSASRSHHGCLVGRAFQSQIFFEQLHGVLRDLDLGLPREWHPIRRQQWGYLGLGQGKKTRVRDFNN
jgi:hypothetical protein